MALDEERLLVSLEARITDFEKRMAQAERRGTKTYTRLRNDSASATRAMEADMARASGRINQALAQGGAKLGAVGKAWATGLIGGFVGGMVGAGVSEIIANVGRIANGVAAIGDEARRAGVSAAAFQEWKFVAEQNRIPIDAMIDGLKELNLRADEFAVTGKGAAAEAFARLGYGAEEVKRKLEDPSALLLEIIGRLQQMDKAAQIRIADELFGGTGGERFVELLAQGEAGIRRTIAEANELGIVMDDAMIAKAAEVDRQFNILANTVGTNLKGAIVSAAAALADFISQFRSFQRQSAGVLRGNLATVQADLDARNAALSALEADAADLRSAAASDPMAAAMLGGRESVLGEARAQRDAALAQRDAMQARLDQIDPPEQFGPPAPAAAPASAGAWSPPAYAPPPAAGGGAGGGGRSSGGGGGGARTADEMEREIAALVKRTEALKAGTLAQAEINPLMQDFGRAAEFAAARAELLLAAQQAGVAITPQLRAQIEGLAAGYANAAAAAAQLDADQAETVARAEAMADLRRETIGGFAKDLLAGADAAEALNAALGRLGDRLLDMALDTLLGGGGAAGGGLGALLGGAGGGGLGALLGGVGKLFGFASGTADTGGRRGEPRGVVHGREAVIPLPSGGKVPVQLQGERGASKAERQRVDVRVGVEVDRGGNLLAFVKEQIARSEPETVGKAVQAVRQGNAMSARFLGR